MLENIIDKVIPTILIALVFGLFTMYSKTTEHDMKIQRVVKFNKDVFKHVLNNHDDIIVLQETIKCMKNETPQK